MVSNVYTKSEILQKLAAKGYFIDTYTLDTFMKKWKVEAIFEDEQGAEFFDKNALDLILTNLFNAQSQQEQENKKEDLKEEILKGIKQEINTVKAQQDAQFQKQFEAISKQKEKEQKNVFSVDGLDNATLEAISGVKLSDGSNLSQKIQDINSPLNDIPLPDDANGSITADSFQGEVSQSVEIDPNNDIISPFGENADIDVSMDNDDMSLLSESLAVQEKFKDYIASELTNKEGGFSQGDYAPRTNEFKLDISERTLSMIARTMAKKIAKHVSTICSQDAKSAAKLESVMEENKKLEQKNKDLEAQNKKLRLLLAETNRNLNSYQPSIFGLYKKVPPSN